MSLSSKLLENSQIVLNLQMLHSVAKKVWVLSRFVVLWLSCGCYHVGFDIHIFDMLVSLLYDTGVSR